MARQDIIIACLFFKFLYRLVLFLEISAANAQRSAQLADLLVGVKDLKIGYIHNGQTCYLTGSAIFKCDADGDLLELAHAPSPTTEDMKYVLKFSGSPLTSEQTERNHRRRALFIPGGTDREQALYIKRNSHNELFSIGFKYDSDNGRRDCKLTYEYEAQFDCRENQDDFEFFIRTTSCSARRVEILPNNNPATDDGTEIVGVVSSGSCDKSTTVLQISHTKELSNAVEIEVTESEETNWESGGSLEVTAGGTIFGVALETTVGVSYTRGGSKGYSTSKSEGSSQSVSNFGGVEINFETPGGGLVLGLATRYRFERTQVPANVIVSCKDHEFTYRTNINVKSKTYGHTQFKSYSKKLENACTEDMVQCLLQLRFDSVESFSKAGESFNRCFQQSSSRSNSSTPFMLKRKSIL